MYLFASRYFNNIVKEDDNNLRMYFDSIEFVFFLPIVFILYWYLDKYDVKFQNVLLLVASYAFYSFWDYRFLSVLILLSTLNYVVGLKIEQLINVKSKKQLLILSVIINVFVLAFFKYCNFFIQSFIDLFNRLGLSIESYSLYIILPIGISFYTFHGLSYLIDVYNNKIKAEASIINYALFVSFFPLLVAGPIERATHLLPQINNKRIFSLRNMSYGLRQMLWGFFKKIVIADNCAEYANTIFNNYSEYSGSTLLLGAFLFTVQIYCDFSGYSDIAIGVAKLLGIDLIKNFSFPYFSKNISEFWRRWHISLSSWFKDYVYIPLGGNKVSKIKQISNTFIVFIISGFWHGAEWKYIFWGALNALFVVPAIVFRSKKKNMDKEEHIGLLSKINLSVSILITFLLTMMMWIFFRAENIQSAILYLNIIFSKSFLEIPNFTNVEKVHQILLLIVVFFIVEWFGRKGDFALERMDYKFKLIVRWFIYYCLIFLIFLFSGNGVEFIYFQF